MLIKIIIPVSIIAMCFGAEKVITAYSENSFNKPVIVNTDNSSLDYSSNPLEVINKESFGDVQGLTKNFGFINENEVLLGCGLSREDFYKKYPNEIDKSNSENYKLLDEQFNDQYGKMYRFNLADGTKHWNLYAARINGNNLVDRVCLYKNINLCGENVTWSPDGKKILFFSANEDIVKNYISFKDKNEVNIITFK